MKKMSVSEIQQVDLEILRFIDSFCKERGIVYFLDSGSLIGAARHKGFIPWDDDMDIRMPRPDYERFVAEFADDQNYRLYAPARKNCFLSYARVCEMQRTYFKQQNPWTLESPGVGIDVFPLDGAPESIEEFEALCVKMNKEIQNLFRGRTFVKPKTHFRRDIIGFGKDCVHFVLNNIRRVNAIPRIRRLQMKIERLRTSHEFTSSKYCCSSILRMSPKGRWLTAWFSDVVYLDFCGEKYPAPIGYDERLCVEYGDWKTPPPESERIGHESYQTMWWRD